MQFLRQGFAALLVAAAGAAAFAQDAAKDGLSLGTPIEDEELTAETAKPGQPYLGERFGDWALRCVKAEEGQDPCQLYQVLKDDKGGAIAELSLFPLPEGQDAEAGATLVTPLETLLTEQVTFSVDGAPGRRYPFSFCTQRGCVARIGLTGDDLATYRRGTTARIRIVPVVAPDQDVVVEASLSGFTAGYDALKAQVAE